MSIFDTPCSDPKYTRNMLIGEIKYMINRGWELNWFTTDKNSFDWEYINKNVGKFLTQVRKLDFKRVDISFFNPTTKKTVYECYELTEYDM